MSRKKVKRHSASRRLITIIIPVIIILAAVIAVSGFLLLSGHGLFGKSKPSTSSISSVVEPNCTTSGTTASFTNSSSSLQTTSSQAPNSILGQYSSGSEPEALVYDPANYLEFVANTGSNTVSVYYDTQIVGTTRVGCSPTGIAYDDPGVYNNQSVSNGFILVTDSASNTVSVINDSSYAVLSIINVGQDPTGIAVDQFLDMSYVTNSGDNTVSVINDTLLKVVATVNVGNDPIGGASDYTNGILYIANNKGNSLTVINETTNQVIGTVRVPSPYGLVYCNTNDFIYVSSNGSSSDSVYAINATSMKVNTTITVGHDPRDLSVDAGVNLLYVSNYASNSVTVIDTLNNSVNSTITNVDNPVGESFNVSLDYEYVTNYLNGTITLIEPYQAPSIGPPTTR